MWDMAEGGNCFGTSGWLIVMVPVWYQNWIPSAPLSSQVDGENVQYYCPTSTTSNLWQYPLPLFSWTLQQYCSIEGILPPLWCAWNGVLDFSPLQVLITFIAFACCFVFFIPFFLSHLGMTLTICCWFGVHYFLKVSCFVPFLEFIPSIKETFLVFLFNCPQVQTISTQFVPFKL